MLVQKEDIVPHVLGDNLAVLQNDAHMTSFVHGDKLESIKNLKNDGHILQIH